MSRWTLHPALRWSFSQLGGHRRQVLLVLAATVVFTACFLAYPLLFKFAIDAAASGLSPATVRNQSLLVLLAGAGAALSYTLLQYARVLLKVQLAQRLRCTLFERFLTSSLSTYLHLPSGDLVVRLGDDLHTYSWLLSSGLFRIVQQLAALALGIPLMLWLDPLLCTTLLVPLVLIVLIYHGWERRFMRLSREIRLTKSELSERITSCFDGIWLIKAYQAEQPQGEVFEQVLGRKRDLELEFMRATLSLHTIYSFMGELGMVVLLLVGGAAVSSGRLTLGDFVAFTNYLWLLVWPMMEVVGFLARLNEMKSQGERLGELEQQADAPLGPRKPVARPGSPPFRSVRAEGLRFRYPGSDQEVFRELDFTLTAGERVLLTGPVGSGKSTLFSLLLGLYPTERLLLDDSPVPHWDPHLLRRGYRYTPQEPRLFSATIEENLVLGRPPLGKAELWDCLTLASLADEIEALPSGLSTILGRRGVTLSGGQRQRLALARALYGLHNASRTWFLLDNISANLDNYTERHLFAALFARFPEATFLIATHKPELVPEVSRTIDLGPLPKP